MRPLEHFIWVCRVVSPFSTRARIIDQAPAPIRWDLVFAVASAHLILPFVHPRLAERGLLELAPLEARDALEQMTLLNAGRNAALAGQMERVSAALNRADIVPVWLKGAARLIEGTRWSTMRPMLDLDLWVPDTDMRCAVGALEAEGYRSRAEDRPNAKHGAPLFHDGETARVELHYRLVDPAHSRILSNESLLAGAIELEWRGCKVGMPCAADQLLNIISQNTAQELRCGLVQARRPLEFVELCSEQGVAASLQRVRDTYRRAEDAAYAESYLALAANLFGLPGEFPATVSLTPFAMRLNFPRLHALWLGYLDMRRYLRDTSFTKPDEFLAKLVRRTWKALRRDDAW
ncbi:MAG: nucleotidyltransferase family protein [Betaproteobacteria bacterium]